MIALNTVVTRAPGIVPRKTGNEYVLVPVSNNIADMDRVYTLNETAAFIWEKLDGKADLTGILSAMQDEFDIDAKTAEHDLLALIIEMKEFLIIEG
jgi:hypothetical protein